MPRSPLLPLATGPHHFFLWTWMWLRCVFWTIVCRSISLLFISVSKNDNKNSKIWQCAKQTNKTKTFIYLFFNLGVWVAAVPLVFFFSLCTFKNFTWLTCLPSTDPLCFASSDENSGDRRHEIVCDRNSRSLAVRSATASLVLTHLTNVCIQQVQERFSKIIPQR